jgi:hypothetical protein
LDSVSAIGRRNLTHWRYQGMLNAFILRCFRGIHEKHIDSFKTHVFWTAYFAFREPEFHPFAYFIKKQMVILSKMAFQRLFWSVVVRDTTFRVRTGYIPPLSSPASPKIALRTSEQPTMNLLGPHFVDEWVHP